MDKGKIVSLEERIPKLKQQRRRKANKRLILLLFMFFFVMACIIYVQSPLSRLKSITVAGNTSYTNKEVIVQSGLSRNTNIWKIDKQEAEKEIEELPEIKKAKVRLQIPNRLLIKVEEYNKVAYLAKKRDYYPVLENGKILKKKFTSQIPENTPLLIDFSEGKVLDELVDSLMILPDEVVNSISEVYHKPSKTDPYRIILYMNDGFEVSATLRSFSEKMAHYPSIISQLDPNIKGVIDLEVGSYFKAYGTEGEEKVEETKDEGEG